MESGGQKDPWTDARFAELRRHMNNRFRAYLAGTSHIAGLYIPRQPGPFRGLPSSILHRVRTFARMNQVRRNQPVNKDFLGNSRPEVRERATHLVKSKIWKLHRAGLKYKRILGAGGLGLAALLEATNFRDVRIQIVAKMVFPGNELTMMPEKMFANVSPLGHLFWHD
jgi:hypothetical protein